MFMNRTLIFLLLFCASAQAATVNVAKDISTNRVTGSLVVPSGITLTIESGGSIVAASGSTVTGFAISDGDKGSITVSGSGATWTIDSGAVTNAMLAGSIDLTTKVTGILPIANIATGTPNGTKFVRDDGTLAVPGGSGTVTHTGGALTANQLVIGAGLDDVAALGSLGTTTTVLHGNAGGAPTFGAVSLTADVSGDLPFANLAQGSALSVLGVTGNATADVASIAAASDHQVLRRSGTAVAFGAVDLSQSAAITGTLAEGNGGTGITSLGSGVATFLGTPSGANLASALTTALPDSKGGTGLTSLGAGVATWLGTPSSANLASAITDETGSGLAVFATAPVFPTSITLGAASGTTGSLLFKGTTSGTVTVKSADAAGTWTLTLPTDDGGADQVLSTNGSGVTSWVDQTGTGGSNWVLKTANYTAVSGDQILADVGVGGSITITMPATPATGDYVWVLDSADALFPGSGLSITLDGNGANVRLYGQTAATKVMDVTGSMSALVFNGTDWVGTSYISQEAMKDGSIHVPVLTTPTFTTSASFGIAGVKVSDDGDGAITFLGLGNGNDEDLKLNLDDGVDGANTVEITSSTGVTQLNLTSINLKAPVLLPTTIELGHATANTLSASGGVVSIEGVPLAKVVTGTVLNRAVAVTSTAGSTATSIPNDNTIPQNTEGAEAITVTITPTSATSKLLIRFNAFFTMAALGTTTVALFQDTTANALNATCSTAGNSNYKVCIPLEYEMTSGTTSATTFKIRYGPDSGTSYFLQGTSAIYSTAIQAKLEVIEIKE